MKQKPRILNRVVAVASTLAITLPMLNGLMTASAAETEQYPYTLFGRNGISVNTSHLCINGNLHANTTVEITSNSRNVNGKITTADTETDRVKHVYADSKIYETYFAENGTVYEEAYTWDEMNIHVNSPVFSYGNMDVSGNISLNSCLGSFMNLTLTGEVSNANNAVLYSKYGDITVDTDNVANINGLIYAPLGTLTIDAPNVNLNGLIIADTIVINGSTVNINGNSNLARFIGNTSEAYDFSGLEYLPEAWLGDADEDGLFDLYEKVIDTDPQNEDTDGDALPDGHEVLILNTDPLLTDSDANGIADSDEDFDGDGLTNLEEYLQQTESFTADTDSDGLTDGEEVHTYGTDPLDSDTDDDKLIDGDEGESGAIYLQYGILFEPLRPDTDGNGVLDGDEVFGQTLEQEIVTEDEVITQVTVDMETNGNIAQNLTIESMQDVDALSSNVVGLIGEPLEFTSATEFDSATISFAIDQSKLGDTAFDNLMILWYNEEEGIFEEMPTDRDKVNSTVSTTTTHFSQYLVVDSVKWYAAWESSFQQMEDACGEPTELTFPLNTYFLIDCSVAMNDADTKEDIVTICQSIIDCMEKCDRAAVVSFSRAINSNTGLTQNKATLTNAIKNLSWDTENTNIEAALGPTLTEIDNTTVDGEYRIIVLTHAEASFSNAIAAMWLFDNQFEHGSVNVISFGGNATETAERFALHTGGDVYIPTDVQDLTEQFGEVICIPAKFNNTDTDEDGVPDLIELYGLKPDGTLINSFPDDPDSDDDGLTDGEELNYRTITYVPSEMKLQPRDYLKYITYWSDPRELDTDGDNLSDEEEYYLRSRSTSRDTDKDRLHDAFEVQLWFDPADPNTDGDCYDDFEEWSNGTSPFQYDLSPEESIAAFFGGAIAGDFVAAENPQTLLGQIAFGFVPMAADARDYFANVFVNQETSSALINLSGFLLDFAPAAGVAGDAAKILPKLADFIIRYVDDAPKVLDAIIQTTKHFPGLERALPDLVHLLPVGVINNLAKSVKNTENLTQTQYAKILNIVDAAGKNADEVIEATRFKSFKALKNYLGDPGPGNEWHHIVEQCQAKATRSGFDIQDINTVANVRATPKDVHKEISRYYSQKSVLTDGMVCRDWLNGKSYEEQMEYGLKIWREKMLELGYDINLYQ